MMCAWNAVATTREMFTRTLSGRVWREIRSRKPMIFSSIHPLWRALKTTRVTW